MLRERARLSYLSVAELLGQCGVSQAQVPNLSHQSAQCRVCHVDIAGVPAVGPVGAYQEQDIVQHSASGQTH